MPRATDGAARRPRRRWLLAALVVAGAAAVARSARVAWRADPPRPTERTLVAITPFDAPAPTLALWREGMMDVLARGLDGAGPLRTVAPAALLPRWTTAVTGPRAIVALARQTGAGAVVVGALRPTGADSVEARVLVHDGQTGETIARLARRASLQRMDRLVDSLTVDLLGALDAVVPVGAVRHVELRSARSLDALLAFLRGEQFYRGAHWDSARVAYERAIGADSAFAPAHRRLGTVLGFTGLVTDSLARAHLLQAGALNQRLGPRDSLLVLADSLAAAAGGGGAGDLALWPLVRRRFATLDALARAYPHDPEVWYEVGEARYHAGAGPAIGADARTTLDAFDRAIRADSAFTLAYAHTVQLGLEVGGAPLALRYLERYQALAPRDAELSGRELLGALLRPPGIADPAVRQRVDTTAPRTVSSARITLRRWPDSAETAVRLARVVATGGRGSTHPPYRDATFRERSLAEQLAYRGHLREAVQVIGDRDALVAVELAYLGGAPHDSAAARLARLLGANSSAAVQALGWWADAGDSAAIRTFADRARARLTSAAPATARLAAAYDTAAAGAYLALARRDTAAALARFVALPDTLCPRCHTHRLTRARLLAARGRPRDALATLRETLVAYLSPFEIVFALDRARLATRLGDPAAAARDYRLVADAWRHADPELQAMVAEARRAVGGGR